MKNQLHASQQSASLSASSSTFTQATYRLHIAMSALPGRLARKATRCLVLNQEHRCVRIVAIVGLKKTLQPITITVNLQDAAFAGTTFLLPCFRKPHRDECRKTTSFFGDVDRHRQHYAAFRKKIAAEGWLNKWR